MTICTPHLKTKPLPTCLSLLDVGTVAEVSSNIRAYFYNLTTKRITTIEGSSTITGAVVLDVSELSFSSNHSYVLTLTLASDDVNSLLTVTIGSQTADQIALRFEDVFNSSGENQIYTIQSVEVEE